MRAWKDSRAVCDNGAAGGADGPRRSAWTFTILRPNRGNGRGFDSGSTRAGADDKPGVGPGGSPMCGRFTQFSSRDELARLFGFDADGADLLPRYNVAPT